MIQGLKGRIIRPQFNTTLGMLVINAERAYGDQYNLTVRYFTLDGALGEGMGEKDSMIIGLDYLRSNFEILTNPNEIKTFKEGKWHLLKEKSYVK